MANGGRPRHPNKEIEAAIRYAEARGWVCTKAHGHAHAWGQLRCPLGQRGGCRYSVWSTPTSARKHADWLRRQVDVCPHQP
jgi:hypothetical protein